MRLVGFDSKKQEQLASFHEDKQTVAIENCQLKKSKFSDEIEIIVTTATTFSKSPKKFNVPVNDTSSASSPTALDTIHKLQNFQNIIVQAKVLTVKEPLEVKPSLLKQDIIVADSTGTARLTVWQEDTNKISVGSSYVFDKVTVRSYDGAKYLTPPKSGWSYTTCANIGDVEDEPEVPRDKNEMNSASVDGVLYIGSHPSCKTCKAKIDPINDKIGKCTRCKMSQRLDKCPSKLSAKLMICAGEKSITLHAYLPTLQRIIKDDTLTDNPIDLDDLTSKLLESDNFNLTYTRNNIINAVYRNQ